MKTLNVLPARLCLVCTFCIVLWGCQKTETSSGNSATTESSAPRQLELIGTDLVKPQYRSLSSQIRFTGTLQARQRTSVQAQTSGTITQVYADNGNPVQKGQTLLRLNNQDDQARLLQARANYTATKAQADLSQNLAERNQRLFKQGFISEIEYERSKADAHAQRENLAAQQAMVNIAQKAVNDAVVSAPISGVVSNRQVQMGQTVATGQTLFEIVDSSSLELQGSAPATQNNIQVGQTIQFQLAGQSQPTFAARISRINPVTDAASRAVQFYANVTSPISSLAIGNYVEGSIQLNNSQSGLVLPAQAIGQDNAQQAYVWVIRQKRLQKINVEVIMQDRASNSVLVKGIQPDDMVSLVKFSEQANGSAVKVS
ncbi:MAG: efflux RND transporter periplasmic adaptor subunit [Moraxellaceae bacterium]|nr:MAG: efflux RND transporter periplasmic adaptor subunit [Moraxellaceae bacterium]